jgi:hypothetical protein
MIKPYTFLGVILIPCLLSGMESNKNEQLFPFNKLPDDKKVEILEFNVREALYNHLRNSKETDKNTRLTKLLRLTEESRKSQDFDCKLLPTLALVDSNFLRISKYLVHKIFKENKTQESIYSTLVLDFAKNKGLKVNIGEETNDFYKKYELNYNLEFPHIFPGIGRGLMGHIKDTSDLSIVRKAASYILNFLMTSYCQDKDPKTLDLLKLASSKNIYIEKEDFSEIYNLAKRNDCSQLIEFLDAQKEKILAQKSPEKFSITDLLNKLFEGRIQ